MRATIDKQTKKSAALEFNQRLARRSCAPKKAPFPNPHAETRTELRSGSTCGASANGSSVIIRVIASRCLRRINVDPYWDIVAAAGILRNYFQISVNGEQARS